MYTYESFGTFTLLRPIFVSFLILLLVLLVIIILPRANSKVINGFTVTCISILSIFVSAQVLFYSGIIVDEMNLGGDAVSTALFLIIAAISILNPIIYFRGYRKENKRSPQL
ncbi:cytochrome bd-type quinol oxidase subunit 2 [Bacillus ectoiniformans]|uniref:hypothetical protein n=1 Tax=Bacillus ectoiniformans TaxID=1494429 RepID=UPI003084269B|nr:cytochrome bd-type quinol oxidase subunit 2 [Bacillus ectoiniformans]